MTKELNGCPLVKALFPWTRRIAALGALLALIFGIWWFAEVSKHCGVVRFYEYILGAVVIVFWFGGTMVGLKISSVARRKQSRRLMVVSMVIVAFVSIGLMLIGTRLICELYTGMNP